MPTILAINSGSSSVKASLFATDGTRLDFRYAHLRDPRTGFEQLFRDLTAHKPDIVGHRFVHGGEINEPARLVDDAERARLQNIVHLAPLHLPGNLMGIELCSRYFAVPQIACFDTAFHSTLPELAKRLPIPQALGLRRFGFHGLNYAWIAAQLPALLGAAARGKIVVAHLGSGASLCLLENLQSVDTSMGYTPAGGITMGTRSGDLDPGVMLELAKRFDAAQLSDLVFHQMGLLALSDGESSEMSQLLASTSAQAQFAVGYFCRQVRAGIGSLAAKAGGIDALVFSGGIGENAAAIRAQICAPLGFLGLELDAEANRAGASRLERKGGKPVLIIPADEEAMIRQLCQKHMSAQSTIL
ncbi:MAG: acetate kinase [Gallionellales bacterium 35-53-114]|jgi:acetate kinase|nr:MAG: acetate kinase [Gallionellales bacterium 35-53-114]OYZ63232.1 MAG: acetate kinase [Gallionellales bacterium 24-53-125]OZB08697.1 MAG: acetate kinase [Gallionellales bacterium 39-52-133]HQS57443.1 acetate kinase [Gallionellaceae bacterium]HQS74369.1 acetate kinase [Gallionellaceae bacterium]